MDCLVLASRPHCPVFSVPSSLSQPPFILESRFNLSHACEESPSKGSRDSFLRLSTPFLWIGAETQAQGDAIWRKPASLTSAH